MCYVSMHDNANYEMEKPKTTYNLRRKVSRWVGVPCARSCAIHIIVIRAGYRVWLGSLRLGSLRLDSLELGSF
jgi:hypothetical protein